MKPSNVNDRAKFSVDKNDSVLGIDTKPIHYAGIF